MNQHRMNMLQKTFIDQGAAENTPQRKGNHYFTFRDDHG